MAKSNRTKVKVISNVTADQAQEASRIYAEKSNRLSKLEAEMNAKIDKIKEGYVTEVVALNETIIDQQAILKSYATEQKESWGKKKSLELMHCIIGFRTGTPKVVKTSTGFTFEGITELLKKHPLLKKFTRSVTTINKELILAEKDQVTLQKLKDDCYLAIDQDESFYVQAKVEEITAATAIV